MWHETRGVSCLCFVKCAETKCFPLFSVSLSLHLKGPAGAAEPLAPYLTNCCHGNCHPLVIF